MEAHIRINIDLVGGLTGQPYELPGVQSAHHHLPGLLDGPEGLRRALVVPVLHRLDLPEDLIGDPADLPGKHFSVIPGGAVNIYLFREILPGQEGSSVVLLQWRRRHAGRRVGWSQGLSGGSVLG